MISKLIVLYLVLGFFLSGCYDKTEKEGLIVAKVGTSQLTTKEFAQTLAFRLRNFDALAVKNEARIQSIKEEIVQDFIVDAITDYWAKENGVNVSEEEVLEQMKRIRSIYPDEFAFKRSLNREHLTVERWKSDIRRSVLQKKIVHRVHQNLGEVSDKEVSEYYSSNKEQFQHSNQIKIQQIVVHKLEKAKSLMEHIKSGGDFAETAKKYSISPEASNGGVTDWIDVDTLDIFKKAYLLPKRSKPKIMKSPFGYHILKVVSRRKKGQEKVKKAQNKIRTLIIQKREQQAYSQWLDEQLRKHQYFKDDKLLASISIETKEK